VAVANSLMKTVNAFNQSKDLRLRAQQDDGLESEMTKTINEGLESLKQATETLLSLTKN
jgi:hypothetical protein